MRLEKARKNGRKFLNPVETGVGDGTLILKAIRAKMTNKAEVVPKVPLGPFRTDVGVYARVPESGLRVTWFGHSSLLLEVDGVTVLVDPMWDERASPTNLFGPKRFFAPTMRLEELPPVDVILITHDHYDHLGKETVRALARLMPEVRWITALGVGRVLEGFGVAAGRVTELNWTEKVTVGGLKITALPARHFSGRYPWNRFETLWASFVIEGAKHRIYHAADSGMWEGFAAIGEQYGPFDLVLLEVGAFDVLWKDIHLGPDGAVEALRALGSGVMMPVHWGLFDLGLHGWRKPMERLRELELGMFECVPGVPTEFLGVGVREEWWRGGVVGE